MDVREGENNMTDQQIKIMFSKEILKINDAAAEMCIRKILFAEENAIDWQKAYEIALEWMPELENYKPE